MRLNNPGAVEMAMAELGLDKKELARHVGVTRQTVYDCLAGKKCRPKTAKKFSDALKMPVSDLFVSEPAPDG